MQGDKTFKEFEKLLFFFKKKIKFRFKVKRSSKN